MRVLEREHLEDGANAYTVRKNDRACKGFGVGFPFLPHLPFVLLCALLVLVLCAFLFDAGALGAIAVAIAPRRGKRFLLLLVFAITPRRRWRRRRRRGTDAPAEHKDRTRCRRGSWGWVLIAGSNRPRGPSRRRRGTTGKTRPRTLATRAPRADVVGCCFGGYVDGRRARPRAARCAGEPRAPAPSSSKPAKSKSPPAPRGPTRR
ncbi:hypothetical protein B0H12DRAFT_313398 [Mycena haematopus]|nr:hypothetical protein B0H12DRAFT_313398 [Mycena haematopus]